MIEISKYDGVNVESYEDKDGNVIYSIVCYEHGKDGKWYKQFVFPSMYDREIKAPVPDTSKKVRPISIRLGRRDEAIQVLRQIASEIQKGGQ